MGEVLAHHVLLADVGVLLAQLRAAIVDVLLLLLLGGDGRAAVATRQQAAAVGELADLRPGVDMAVHPVLHPLEQLPGNQPRVLAVVQLAAPVEAPGVQRVLQDAVHLARRDLAAPRPPIALLAGIDSQAPQRPLPGVVQLEEHADEHRTGGIGHDAAPAVLAVVEVANGRRRGPVPVGRLVVHALADLLGEVVHVVLGHEHLDAMDELLGRAGVVGEHHALLHEMHVDVERVDRHPVLQVAVQPIGLLDEDDRLGLPLLAQGGQHLPELGAPRALGRLDVGVLVQHVEAVLLGVGPEQVELGGDGEALALLLTR